MRQKVIAVQADEMAHKDGVAKLAELQKSNATTGFSAPLKVSRNDAQGVPPAALSAIYKADAQKLPAYVGVDLGDDGYAIYRVNAVVAGAPIDPQRLAAAQQQIAQVDAQSEVEAYVEALRARSKVKFYGSLDSAQSAQATAIVSACSAREQARDASTKKPRNCGAFSYLAMQVARRLPGRGSTDRQPLEAGADRAGGVAAAHRHSRGSRPTSPGRCTPDVPRRLRR